MSTKNPIINATLAALYIVLIVSLINFFGKLGEGVEETIIIPMVMLSLFVLSAAIMGYLFVLEPLKLYLDGHKQEAVNFFLKTVGAFACYVVIFTGILLYTFY